VASMSRATRQQPLQRLPLAGFEMNVSHGRRNRACARKFPLSHMRRTSHVTSR
jgi:hypothetical protein